MNIELLQLEKILQSSVINLKKICIHGVCTDSRVITTGDLFVPLHGKNFDGHDYIKEAKKNGAIAVLSEYDLKIDIPYLKVKDTLAALAKLATYYSSYINPITIGITGTNGKTTVTDMTAKITSQYKSTLKTYKNFNNNIGLPLSVLKAKDTDEIFVLEMGASRIGDIRELINIAKPSIVALLNVSEAHLETFKSIDNILTTKEEIFLNQGSAKTVILNKDDKYFERWTKKNTKNNIKTISSNDKNADYSILDIKKDQILIHTPYEDPFNITLKNFESYNITNIMFSVALACESGARSKHIVPVLNKYIDMQGRLKIYDGINNSKIIDGSYNANPESFKSSINYLTSLEGLSWVIMGQMGELEAKSEEYHINVALHAKERGVEKLFMISEHSEAISRAFGTETYIFKNTQELIECIKPIIGSDINILVKASRFMKFETIVDELIL